MASSSIVKNRRDRILGILNHRGDASVDELSADLGVSLVTIRRDLDFLDSQGMLIRKHGGAQSSAEESDAVMENVPEKKLEEKDSVNIDEKTRIAEKAAALVKDGDIIFTNSGSTILSFIASIRSKRVKVITNNAAAITMKKDPGMELIILGGEYREQSRSFVGEFAVKMIKDIYSGCTFLGVNGLSLERGLMTSVYQECSINQAMIANTHEKVVVLADYSKMGKVSNFVSSPLSSVDIVITDDKCPDQLVVDLERLGIRVLIA